MKKRHIMIIEWSFRWQWMHMRDASAAAPQLRATCLPVTSTGVPSVTFWLGSI